MKYILELRDAVHGPDGLRAEMKEVKQDIYGPDGLKSGLEEVANQSENNTFRLDDVERENALLKAENKQLKDTQRVLIGLVQKQNEKMDAFQSQLDDQQQRSMKENIIIHNYDNYELADGESNYRPIAVKFLTEEMGMTEIEPREVFVAHKLSENSNAIIAKVAYPLKEEIMQRRGALENKKNSAGLDLFVTEQTPEAVRARRKDLRSEAEKNHKMNQN